MSTVTRHASPVDAAQARAFGIKLPEPAPDAPRVLTIKGTPYRVEPIALHPEIGHAAYRLAKQGGDGAVYDVVRTAAGVVECDCASYEFNCRGTLGLCKHGRAVVEAGLLDRPGFAEELSEAVGPIPTEGEGQGEAGEDLGPADPIDDLDADDLAPSADWDDSATWNLGPQTYTMRDMVEAQVRGYRAWGNELGDLLAHHMGVLLDELDITKAMTPEQHEARAAALGGVC